MPIRDALSRPLGSLRLSVTDRCNLRCWYCMPEENYAWLPRASILSFEEMGRLAGIFAGLGARKVRLTGGEPLLRQDLPSLAALLAKTPGVEDVAVTTNGILLAGLADSLAAAGLRRITVSLDTLRPERFQALTRSSRHADVLAGIDAANAAGFVPLKLNTVVIRGFNDDEIPALLDFGRRHAAQVRFIEYMDVGGATQWSSHAVVPRAEILAGIEARFGPASPRSGTDPAAPAEEFVLPDGTAFGIIASTTAPFCRSCDRSRVTADGIWFLCLYAEQGTDLRELLRGGASNDEISAIVREIWAARTDRGAETRAGLAARGALYQIDGLKRDPHREMHTRGG